MLYRLYLISFLSDVSPFFLINNDHKKQLQYKNDYWELSRNMNSFTSGGFSFPPVSSSLLFLFKFTSFFLTWTLGPAQRLTDVALRFLNRAHFVLLQMVWPTVLAVWWPFWQHPDIDRHSRYGGYKFYTLCCSNKIKKNTKFFKIKRFHEANQGGY